MHTHTHTHSLTRSHAHVHSHAHARAHKPFCPLIYTRKPHAMMHTCKHVRVRVCACAGTRTAHIGCSSRAHDSAAVDCGARWGVYARMRAGGVLVLHASANTGRPCARMLACSHARMLACVHGSTEERVVERRSLRARAHFIHRHHVAAHGSAGSRVVSTAHTTRHSGRAHGTADCFRPSARRRALSSRGACMRQARARTRETRTGRAGGDPVATPGANRATPAGSAQRRRQRSRAIAAGTTRARGPPTQTFAAHRLARPRPRPRPRRHCFALQQARARRSGQRTIAGAEPERAIAPGAMRRKNSWPNC